ncbi:hypothetical protein D8674_002915 [Pyrus ussuriensis x Pyrus communis]|uniref:GIR1-like zinc ribbon domain-containing protein n=1 Tax=Pyrus ussuriensis x Pyrus communis TaxID=2448454 RepID=A0A5N5FKU5_9ROSA|nr:uncharacterized protein LOC103933752 [Pyrus x bretschneideri]KAB2601910.1 hypothetical protein D8674_002915 [Pyrus ussuriensis x Pyrus communis]
MAADVSSLFRVLSGYSDDQHLSVGSDSSGEESTALITRDLLGGSGSSSSKLPNDSQELDLDLQVPNGWEKRLDLKSGKVYLQRCSAQNSHSNSDQKSQTNRTVPKMQDLNFPPSASSKIPLNLFDETSTNLDLKLVSSSPPPSCNYQSLCTLDKVKSALERAEKEPIKRRSSSMLKSSMSSSPTYSSSSSPIKETQEEDSDSEDKQFASPFAAGCPGCLSYVLTMRNNPKCPRCNSVVPLPTVKKPRIDLNRSN